MRENYHYEGSNNLYHEGHSLCTYVEHGWVLRIGIA
jgi:hypothetical protein